MKTDQKIILRTQNITRRLSGDVPVTLVEAVTLDVLAGEFAAITGPSGSGKSSLLYMLGLLDKPTAGQLWLHGQDLSGYSDEQRADLRLAQIGFIFQFHFLLPEFTALENVMLPMQRLAKWDESVIRTRAQKLLGDVGLADHMHKIPRKLSGGQQQRVAIARALANDPALIIADEPTGNLDTAASATVRGILKDLAHQHGRAVLAVTHEKDFAAEADRIFHLVDGRLVDTTRVPRTS